MEKERMQYVVEQFHKDGTHEPVKYPPRRGWWLIILMMWDALRGRRREEDRDS